MVTAEQLRDRYLSPVSLRVAAREAGLTVRQARDLLASINVPVTPLPFRLRARVQEMLATKTVREVAAELGVSLRTVHLASGGRGRELRTIRAQATHQKLIAALRRGASISQAAHACGYTVHTAQTLVSRWRNREL